MVNRIAPLAIGATLLTAGLLIGISLLVRPPDVGPPGTPKHAHAGCRSERTGCLDRDR